MNENELTELIKDFCEVAEKSNIDISVKNIDKEILEAPHKQPKNLPTGKKAVYIFMADDRCLKVGQVGPNSNARFTSQHYNPWSSGSNLAKSILKSKDLNKEELPQKLCDAIDQIYEGNVGDWIKNNTSRINIFINGNKDKKVLNLLEIFIQCRLDPFFEG